MTEADVFEAIRRVLAGLEDFSPLVPPEDLTPDHRLVEDLGVDSVALLDLAMGLEAELGVAIDESALVTHASLGAIARALAEEA